MLVITSSTDVELLWIWLLLLMVLRYQINMGTHLGRIQNSTLHGLSLFSYTTCIYICYELCLIILKPARTMATTNLASFISCVRQVVQQKTNLNINSNLFKLNAWNLNHFSCHKIRIWQQQIRYSFARVILRNDLLLPPPPLFLFSFRHPLSLNKTTFSRKYIAWF